MSPNVEKFLGYKPDEIIGEIPVKFMPPEEGRLKYALFVNIAARNKKIKSLELTIIHKDGHVVTMEANAAPYFSQDGAFLGYRGVSRDTTEHNRIQEQLKASKIKLMESVKDLQLMNRIANILLTTPDDYMYGEVLQAVLEMTESPHGVFGYIDENGDVIAPSLTRDIWDKCRIEEKSIRFPKDTWTDTVWVRAILQKKTIISNQPGKVPKGHIPIKRVMVTPLLFQNRTIGYLKVANRPSDYTAKDQALLERIAGFIAPALDARLQRDFEGRKRKAAEEALKTSQQDLKHAQAVAHTGSWRLDLIRNKLSWSDEAYKIFDVPRGTALSYEYFLSRVHPDDRERLHGKWAEALPGEVYDLEFRIMGGDSVKWVRGRTELEFDERRNVRGGFGTVQDITDRKRMQNALRESEERFRSFMNNSPTIAWIKDEQGRYVYVSETYEKRFGLKSEEITGKFDVEIWPEDIAAEFWKNDQKVLAEDRVMEVIEQTPAPGGGREYWWNFKFPFRDAAGNKYIGGPALTLPSAKEWKRP